MDLSAYLFATYVFILLTVTIWLLGRVLRKSKKAGGSDKASFDKEQKLFALYQNVEDMLASFEEYVEETQSEADKNLSEMREMLGEVKRLADALKVQSTYTQTQEMAVPVPERHEEPAVERSESLHLVAPVPIRVPDEPKRPAPVLKMSKTGSKVLELKANGMDQSQIAKHLGISLREVSLAMKIAGAEDK